MTDKENFGGKLAAYGYCVRGDENTSEDLVATACNEADALRIAACWNACHGIETKTLIATDAGAIREALLGAELRRVVDQRGELLAALQAFRDSVPDNRHAETAGVDPYHIEIGVLEQIDAAIAKATGGAA